MLPHRLVLASLALAACGDSSPATGDDAAPDASFTEDATPAPVFVVSNHDQIGDLPTSGPDRGAPELATFDTTTQCVANTILGDCVVGGLIGAETCVCRVGSLTTSSLTIQGDRTLTILAASTVVIGGPVVIAPGAGAATITGPGGTGGSYGSAGGNGGIDPWGTETLVPLRGGMDGQPTAPASAKPGRGGGAIQISAGSSIAVPGSINAGGGGGDMNCQYIAAAGGGSGGAILLEAPTVVVGGALATNGGGGAGAMNYERDVGRTHCAGAAGSGTASLVAARGGVSDGTSNGSGGLGSIRAGAGGSGGAAGQTTYWEWSRGGGGGGAGRIRINTESGSCAGCSGLLSGVVSYGALDH